jgi:hypothetical protein
MVVMFSGCSDHQTSADVSNTETFELPASSGPAASGGACTCSILHTLDKYKNKTLTWVELLEEMRTELKNKGYTQLPQLSSSQALPLTSPFSLVNPHAKTYNNNRPFKACLVGINYVGHSVGALSGCVNDVVRQLHMLKSQGFDIYNPNQCKVIVDDKEEFLRGHPGYPDWALGFPNKAEIIAGWEWLINGVQAGDSLFMHYSGHGGQVPDKSGDEADGYDETVIPFDYKQSGQIVDDFIFDSVAAKIPKGAHLTAIMDCCHSGTLMDLPFTFVPDDNALKMVKDGNWAGLSMGLNKAFNAKYSQAFGVASNVFSGTKKMITRALDQRQH